MEFLCIIYRKIKVGRCANFLIYYYITRARYINYRPARLSLSLSLSKKEMECSKLYMLKVVGICIFFTCEAKVVKVIVNGKLILTN